MITPRAKRRILLTHIAMLVLAALAIFGGFFDRSIRPDPFSSSPGFFDWLLSNQPHPALKRMPVVPIGWRGTLAIRPSDTRWINVPWLPRTGEMQPAAGASLWLIAPAQAGMSPEEEQRLEKQPPQQQANPPANQAMPSKGGEPAQRQQVPAPYSQTALPPQVEAPPLVPARPAGMPPRLFAAHSSADGRQIWIGGDESRILRSRDGGATWTELQTGLAAGTVFSLAISNGTVQALTSERWTLTTSDDSASWTGEPTLAEAEGFYFGDERQPSLWFYSVSDPGAPQKSPLFLPGVAAGRALGTGLLFLPQTLAVRRDSGVFSASFTATGDGRIEVFPVTATTTWEEAAEQTLVAAKSAAAGLGGINAFARQLQADVSVVKVWLAGDGGALALATLPTNPDAPASVDDRDVPTGAALRSIYVQPDGKIGWASSGWFDGNEEDDRPVVLQTTDGGGSWQRLSYRHMPAPWLLYLVLPGLVAAAYGSVTGFLDLRKAAKPRASVADEASSDRPISWEDKDALGLQPIAGALSKFLRNRNTDPPVTFAITGPWGSGKSSLMNLLAEDLRCFDTRPVWFNAWHHQKEDHLLAALLENIRSQAPPPWWRWTGIVFRARLFWFRSGRLLGRLALIALIAAAALTTIYLLVGADNIEHVRARTGEVKLQDLATKPLDDIVGGLLGGLTALGSIGVALYSLAMLLMKLQVISLNPAKLMSTLSGTAGSSALRDQLSFRHKFASEFAEVCRALRVGASAGMVIMIDDLDRCRAGNVLEILEAVNFLTTAGRCFVILAIDEEKVISAVAYGFKESILTLPKPGEAIAADEDLKPDARQLASFARNYLEKLINISVPVPGATAEATVVLLNALDGEAPPVSAWPRRLRRGLRESLDVAAALALFVGIAGAAFLGLKALTPFQATPAATSEGAAAARVERVAPRPPEATGTGETAPAPATGGAEGADIALVDATTVEANGRWLHETPLALALLLVVVFASGRVVALREVRVEDSIDFRDALRIWSPVIFAAHPTPRGLKRYQNRLRYLAMRARGDERMVDWIDRLFGQDEAPPPVTTVLPEPTLVGLGALWAFKPDLLDESADAFDARIDAARSPAAKSIAGLGLADGDPARPLRDVRDILAVVRDDFKRNFPDLWPPTEEQISAFRTISGTAPG